MVKDYILTSFKIHLGLAGTITSGKEIIVIDLMETNSLGLKFVQVCTESRIVPDRITPDGVIPVIRLIRDAEVDETRSSFSPLLSELEGIGFESYREPEGI